MSRPIAEGHPEMRPSDFEEVRRIAYERFGLDLKPGKESLVAARLGKRVRKAGLSSVRQFLDLLKNDRSGERLAEFIDDLTTNFTSFLREPAHFDFLVNRVLTERPPPRTVRVWSAACSTGEEPYSILFTLLNAEPSAPDSRFEIHASDISRPALEKAQRAIYAKDRFTELPAEWLSRYLQEGHGQWTGYYRVRPAIASKVRFQRRNLVESITGMPPFDVIFCRNVMIYFDSKLQQQLVSRFHERLEPGGYLFIGHSEGLMGIQHGLEFVKPAIYRKPGSPKR